jgi:rRNA maturation endonuclease Nob1
MIWKFIAKRLGISAVRNIMEKRSIRVIQNHEKRIRLLEQYSHIQSDFICLKCGCKAKRKTKKRRK